MVTLTVNLNIPDEMAAQLEERGLLQDSEYVERTLWAQLDQDRAWQKLQAVFADADADPERMTMEEVVTESKTFR